MDHCLEVLDVPESPRGLLDRLDDRVHPLQDCAKLLDVLRTGVEVSAEDMGVTLNFDMQKDEPAQFQSNGFV